MGVGLLAACGVAEVLDRRFSIDCAPAQSAAFESGSDGCPCSPARELGR